MDLVHRLLVSSDPVVSTLRTYYSKTELPLTDDAKSLLKCDDFNCDSDNSDTNLTMANVSFS